MRISASQIGRWIQNIKIYRYNFENVITFNYVGLELNKKGNVHEEINTSSMAGNKAYFAKICLQKSSNSFTWN
jgi:hypothetical protein